MNREYKTYDVALMVSAEETLMSESTSFIRNFDNVEQAKGCALGFLEVSNTLKYACVVENSIVLDAEGEHLVDYKIVFEAATEEDGDELSDENEKEIDENKNISMYN